MMHLDEHPDVLEWSSEEIIIPYRSPIDRKLHRYYPDFLVKKRNRNGVVETVLIEVKPLAQTQPPTLMETKNNKPTRRYIKEVMTWGVNSAKWKAAEEYCKDRKWKFVIITERELGINANGF